MCRLTYWMINFHYYFLVATLKCHYVTVMTYLA